MFHTKIGKTEIPVIALGTWSWGTGINGGNYVFGNSLGENELRPVFQKAMTDGLTLWDTAAVYGMGASETILGNLISENTVKPVLSTKFTPMPLQTKSSMQKSLKKSMQHLKANSIDIYWIHNPTNVSKWTKLIIPLVKNGTVKHVGVSNHNLDEIKQASQILENAGLKLSAVQNHYSLLYRASEDSGIIDWCQKNGVKFFSYMVLEQGALTGRYDEHHLFPAKSRRGRAFGLSEFRAIFPLVEKMKLIGAKYEAQPAEIAIAWAISKGTLPIVGVTKVNHVESAVKASNIKLTEEETKELEAAAKSTGVCIKADWEKAM